MERLIITNGKLILPTGIEMGQTLICENGKIEQIIPNESYQPLVGDKVIDARQNYVSPGFIDMHIHGGGGHDFMDGTVEAFLRWPKHMPSMVLPQWFPPHLPALTRS